MMDIKTLDELVKKYGDEDSKLIVEIPLITLDKEWDDDIETKLAHLLIKGVIFCNNGWWYEKEGIPWKEDAISLHVNCNDVFAWGCADAEDITHDEIHDLYEMWKKDPNYGSAAWCIKKRKQMPQGPLEDIINEEGIWNLKELIK